MRKKKTLQIIPIHKPNIKINKINKIAKNQNINLIIKILKFLISRQTNTAFFTKQKMKIFSCFLYLKFVMF